MVNDPTLPKTFEIPLTRMFRRREISLPPASRQRQAALFPVADSIVFLCSLAPRDRPSDSQSSPPAACLGSLAGPCPRQY